MTKQNEEITKALDDLMTACGYKGESGTEWFFGALSTALDEVEENWNIVIQSYEDGLCYNINALLADALENAVINAGPQT